MSETAVCITGAAGELGHALINYFLENTNLRIVAFDIQDSLRQSADRLSYFKADVCDKRALESISNDFSFITVFHFAGILSTGGEKDPLLAHQVNVDGSVNMLEIARQHGERRGEPTKFIFPSTIAAYGFHDAKIHAETQKVREDQFLQPITCYGINKLYVESLGHYYDSFYCFLNQEHQRAVDFRSVRFPGILSALTVPTGGTSDFGPEMLHAAAKGEPYGCFVNPETRIPFMVMSDAIRALINLSNAPKEKLTQHVYNVSAFSVSAEQIRARVLEEFPEADITYDIHEKRLAIVESWPLDVDDTPARNDWGWSAEYNFEEAFGSYLIPAVKVRYA